MAMKTKPTKTPTMATGAGAKAASTKKRRRDAPAAVAADAVAAPIHVSAKKQRLEEVSAIAKDVMLELLRGELSYTVRDDEWEKLVALTQQHPNFAKHFAFPAASEPGWVTPKKKTKPTHLKILALDCEMCVTAPLARAADRKSNALCRVSAVDGEDMIRGIVSDLIVHQPEPGYRLIDAKTDIHGITVAMIDQSKISVEKAQKYLLKYINADTILVGHSIHGDLASLRINHTRVIDTAKIFQRKQGDAARATPGLKCLTKFLLRFEMPDGHDSTIDAQASMLAAKYAARHECGAIIPSALELHGPRAAGESRRGGASETYAGPPKIVPSGFQLHIATPDATTAVPAVSATSATRVPMNRPPPQEVMAARSCQLRVHHIPRGITAPDLEHFFVQTAKVVPAAVETPLWKDQQRHGAANVTFASALHAQLAFDALAGGGKKEALDAIGRPQKLVTVTTTKGKKYKGIKVGVM